MAKRRAKRKVVKASATQASNSNDDHQKTQIEKQQLALSDHEVECQIAPIRAIRDMETDRLLTRLRLLRSNLSEEQLKTPILQFLKENLPNLSVVRDERNRRFELEWENKDANLSMSHADERNIHPSLLQLMSIAYPDCATEIPNFSGFEHLSNAVKRNFFRVANLQAQTQLLQLPDAFPNPEMNAESSSIGMKLKTPRLPKHGEMLVSVHGSPLGVYNEDNMEAIHESEEG
ncbi:uncharacterized protein LOC122094376 isoform X2 [Macadamia integrifolia]|uniref:uncharacterized protein LOC122094376 isoform X2 n=1 Tax=Macadamia integrifolia TaxID=60698 RepID=UPI001C527C82|nr:uncharacterized protein LOC122094376 isoform X2 [Macadamia integrifolia]